MHSQQPNFLVIMDDQHRWDYINTEPAETQAGRLRDEARSSSSPPPVDTPNLSRLASQGIHFTQCVCNSPLCAPSRIGLATGLLPERVGALDNYAYAPRSRMTYYQRLRDYGYRVGLVGKLDLSKPDSFVGASGARPSTYGLGFTDPFETEGKMNAGMANTPDAPYRHFLHKRGLLARFFEDYQERMSKGWVKGVSHDSVLPSDAFHDVFIGRRATQWIEDVGTDFPWHLFVSFVGPHTPFDPPAEYAAHYRNRTVPPAIGAAGPGKPQWVRDQVLHMDDAEIAHTRRQYAAAVTVIDTMIGEILAALEKRGMRENTVILFCSDHGEMLGDHGRYDKSVAYESALRVPLIVSGPGIPSNRQSSALVELNDLNPTICELAGLPKQENIDARSFSHILENAAIDHREVTVAGLREFRAIRSRRHKLIVNSSGELEFYDLEADPQEAKNLCESDRELANEPVVNDLMSSLRRRFLEGEWRR